DRGQHRHRGRGRRLPRVRREDPVAEEGGAGPGRRPDRHREQGPDHRGAARHHGLAAPGRPRRAGRAQRCRQVDAAAAHVRHLRADARAGAGRRQGRAGVRPGRRDGPGDQRAGQHPHPRAVPRHDPQGDGGPRRRHRRVHRARRLPRHAAAHLLHRHAGAARARRRDQRRPADPAARRGHRGGGRGVPGQGARPAQGAGRPLRDAGVRQPLRRVPRRPVQHRDLDGARHHQGARAAARRAAPLQGPRRDRGAAEPV
ncbi:MAG: O-antigen export system, ATP-binding protein, partial [uncultured Pseudonocardia sp.]